MKGFIKETSQGDKMKEQEEKIIKKNESKEKAKKEENKIESQKFKQAQGNNKKVKKTVENMSE